MLHEPVKTGALAGNTWDEKKGGVLVSSLGSMSTWLVVLSSLRDLTGAWE